MQLSPFLMPVVTAEEMSRLERWAVMQGGEPEFWIESAGRRVAERLLQHCVRSVALLIGKGNKGADAYAAGLVLLEKGVRVSASPLFPEENCSSENRLFKQRFLQRGGRIEPIAEPILAAADWLVDGMLGSGFRYERGIESRIEGAIEKAHRSGRKILAIDLPSGVDGTSGMVCDSAIAADETLSLGFAKLGLFGQKGWPQVGRLLVEDFGFPASVYTEVRPAAYMPHLTHLHRQLPLLLRTRHKYQAGYVVALSGSSLFPGSAKLAGLAALRSGAGMVRIFSRTPLGEAPWELICQTWHEGHWERELQRAHALWIGPGLAHEWSNEELQQILDRCSLPLVVDADGLRSDLRYPSDTLLTPHYGEALRLLQKEQMSDDLPSLCRQFADDRRCSLLLKGAPTWIFTHGSLPVVIPWGDPGMATAGAGDVLTGILASLLAQRVGVWKAAILGATLHALAGEVAAQEKTSYGVIASDLIAYLPQAFSRLRGDTSCQGRA